MRVGLAFGGFHRREATRHGTLADLVSLAAHPSHLLSRAVARLVKASSRKGGESNRKTDAEY